MDHLSYIDQILDLKNESLQPVAEYTITIDSAPYTISKKIKENLFIAQDSDSKYIVQFINNPPDSESLLTTLKTRESMIPVINGLNKSVHESPDGFIILSKYTKRVSLQEYLEFKRDSRIPKALREKTEICIDVLIKATQELISSVSSLEKHGFIPASLESQDLYVEINQNPLHPIYIEENYGFEIKIDLITADPLKPPLKNPLEDLGLCVFSSFRNKMCKKVNFKSKKLRDLKARKGYPFALCGLIDSLQDPEAKAEEILFSPLVSTWIFLFKDNDSIPQQTSFNIDALLAGLYFKNKFCRIKSVFTMISQEKEMLVDILRAKPCSVENSRKVVQCICRVKNWNRYCIYAKNAVFILNELVDENFVQDAGMLKLYKSIHMPEVTIEFLNKICSSEAVPRSFTGNSKGPAKVYPKRTMTAACIFSTSNTLVKKIANTEYFLSVLPYMNFNTISCLSNSEAGFLNPYQRLKILSRCPISIRRLRIQDTIDIINKNIIISENYSYTKLVAKAIKIIRELVYDSRKAHENNKLGKCYLNERNLNVSVLMMYCEKCLNYMCLVCGSSHEEIHNSQYFVYIQSNRKCMKSGEYTELCKDVFSLNEISLEFFDSFGEMPTDMVFCTGGKSELISVTSTEEVACIYDDTSHSTLLYYEVEIISAGYSENISIGIDGIGVFYCGNTGHIVNSEGTILKKVAKFGTGDTIGIGFTSSHFLYYTYNGFNLHLYTECSNVNEIRPLVKIKGKGIKVKMITKNFLFCQAPYADKIKDMDGQLRLIDKWINKCGEYPDELYRISNIIEGVPLMKDLKVPRVYKKKSEQKKMNACKESCLIN